MIKLNDSNLFIGEIKQILKDFNLPKCLFGNYNNDKYSTCLNNSLIINDNVIYLNTNKVWNKVADYKFNNEIQNLTTNFTITDLLYDRQTHRYLGKYLRFIKYSKNVNLMSLYNCFDNDIKSIENGYIYYYIPVALNEVYTINNDTKDFEVYATLDVNTKDDSILSYINDLESKTKMKSVSNKPMLYDKLKNIDDTTIISSKSDNHILYSLCDKLRLVMKVKSNKNTHITVLEGDYTSKNRYASCVISENEISETGTNNEPILLSHRNSKNYLLADKLVEYLTGNCITELSEYYDIKKYQLKLNNNKSLSNWSTRYYGVWDKGFNISVNQYISTNKFNDKLTCYDLLGYIDKDVESKIGDVDNG